MASIFFIITLRLNNKELLYICLNSHTRITFLLGIDFWLSLLVSLSNLKQQSTFSHFLKTSLLVATF